ncbi:hypothetical protein DOTSEDRAFT_39594 [Dothistroma septosporum NZE10]|uniref:Uncharacterized protein n=1 Tax=Dothistroma septosporum (strain NZE10 / CBS 128990) TaxID=675120 RepID=M2WHH6_DOTSN|nr:hypothetical protein DOTSEDRAFT_39594 [Dothistroma septosporum NZE10]
MFPYPYPVPRPQIVPTRSERRLCEHYARNIGQVEGYGAAVRDMMGARAAQQIGEVEAKPKTVESREKSKQGTKKTTRSVSQVTDSAQEKYREYKETKSEKERENPTTPKSQSKTNENAFEKYQHFKNKHYEYRGLLQEDSKSSKKDQSKGVSTRGRWDSTTAKFEKTQPKDSSDVRREKQEREEYYQRRREKESRARYYEQRRVDEARRQEQMDRYAYEQQLRERRAALEAGAVRGEERIYATGGGGHSVRAEPRRRMMGDGRQIWWGERV